MKQEALSPLLAEGASLRLCEQVARLRYEDLPSAVVSTLKALVIDELGVIAGASHAPGHASSDDDVLRRHWAVVCADRGSAREG